jgi:glyoxylase-like metal-dependent hydrolase (beta-lactamase superfamily II)
VISRLLACAAVVVSLAGVSEAGTVRLEQVGPNTFYAEGVTALGSALNRNFISNAGVVIAPEAVIVIDALGSVDLAEQLIEQIRTLTPKPITHVIVTHYHADHIYGLQAFRDIGATIIAQSQAKLYLNSDTAQRRLEVSREQLAPWVDESTQLQAADIWIDADTEMMIAGWLFQILKVGPAHTPDDLAVYVPQEQALFAGDLVFRQRIPYVGTADSAGWIRSLDRLIELQASVMVPGHGPYSTEVTQDIAFTRDYLQFLRDQLAEPAYNLEDFEQTYSEIDWSAYEDTLLFREANRMNAYNVFISIQQE